MLAMTQMAAAGGVWMPVSNMGTSKPSSIADTLVLMSAPPSTTPSTIEATVVPSIQPFAATSCFAGSSSVRMPYLAGEYAAAPRPTTAYAASGCTEISIRMHPTTLIALVISMTLPLAIESANAPTSGASTTYETTKHCCSAGVIHSGDLSSVRRAMAAISSALSASDEKNCAAMIV